MKQAELVRLIYDSYEELGSAGAVTRRLSDMGIRYPAYETRKGEQRGGKLFQKQKVTRILSNTVYIGRIRWGEEEYDGIHEPIIAAEQFERVQNQLRQTRKRRMNLRKAKGRCYLLSGLLRCSCGSHMSGYSTRGRNRTHYYYRCSIQNHEGGQYSCSSPRVPAEALEDAVTLRIRELGNALEAREKIVDRAVACLDEEAAKLDEESGILLRQQTRTKSDIGQLLEVLKSQGARALKRIQDELNRLEREAAHIQKRLTEIEQRREPMKRISEDAKAFVRTREDVGELLEAATHEERQQLLHHYVEVIELNAYDKKGKKGTYAMRLFPEVRPDRNFEWQEVVPIIGSIDAGSDAQESGPETKNGAADDDDDNSDSLSDSDPVCITDQKAPQA